MGVCCYWKITSRWYREGKVLVYIFFSLASSRILFEGLAVRAGSFGTLQLREYGTASVEQAIKLLMIVLSIYNFAVVEFPGRARSD